MTDDPRLKGVEPNNTEENDHRNYHHMHHQHFLSTDIKIEPRMRD